MASDIEVEDFLSHHGVKGQRWGVRNNRTGSTPPTPGIHPKVNRMAAKDAKEHARAKLYYGEGAGNRRKLIKAKVEYNSKHVDGYSKAFDSHISRQNLADHASKATKERNRTDRKDKNKKRIGAVARRLTGEFGTQAAFVALAISGAAFANSDKGRRFLNNSVSKIQNSKSDFTRRQGAKHISDILKNMER